ncbi:MAG: putative glutamine ABC transporter permease protein GlnM [Candidatus Heimdallarchaeota archaeon LC_2]|nr:MAG: putative glutamine ABC transporter permease protein GlnM [Candidatus Heimdallarchaeota archaeon LC_2]
MRRSSYLPLDAENENDRTINKKHLFYIIGTFFLIILLVPSATPGQDINFGWNEQLHPIGTDLNDIVYINSSFAWAIGNEGKIISTKDAGILWEIENSGVITDLYEIEYSNETLMVVGEDGTVLRKTTLGDWENMSPSTTVAFNGLSIITKTKGDLTTTTVIVAGEFGEIWKSIDGGENWITIDASVTDTINDVEFFNETHGFIVGENSLLVGTIDGGIIWEPRDFPINTQGTLHSMVIVNWVRMYIVGEAGLMLKSSGSNIGWDWISKNTTVTSDLYTVSASSVNKVFMAGESGTVVLTLDGGAIFKQQKIPTQYNTSKIIGIDANDGTNGWVVGENGLLLITSTGGVAPRDIPTVRDFSDWNVYWDFAGKFFYEGLGNIIQMLFFTIALGFTLGLTLGIIRTTSVIIPSPRVYYLQLLEATRTIDWVLIPIKFAIRWFWLFIQYLAIAYIDFVRNTPLLVQLFIIHFGLPEIGIILSLPETIGFTQWGLYISPPQERVFVSAILGLGLNSAAYQAEIFRSGIQSIPKGQMEAGRSVGLTYLQTMKHIILPQALRVTIPPLGNEIVNLVLNTSLTSTIGYFDLTRAGRIVIATTFLSAQTYALLLLFYFILTYPLSIFFRWLEVKTKIPGLGLK